MVVGGGDRTAWGIVHGMLPLAGIRVIDFGRYIAGPYCGMLLADMGADVIRVDRPGGSEDRWVGPITDGGEGGLFLSLNRNKRSLTLDTEDPKAPEVIRRLVGSADVVIANLPIDVMRKMGIDYDSLRGIRPDIILAMISAFGQDGPYSQRVGFDGVVQAMSGAMSLTGFPGPPIRAVVPFEDYGTALHTAFGVMVALYHRAQTGEGQLVDASLLATGVTFMLPLLAERHMRGIVRTQIGNAGYYSAPGDCYPTKDGWIVVAVIGEPMFRRCARLIGRPDLIEDGRFSSDWDRAVHADVIGEAMTAWSRERTTGEAVAALEKARVPCGPVQTLGEVLEDSQVKARGLLEFVAHPQAAKEIPVASTPVRLSKTPGSVRRRPPLAGEHTEEILSELGLRDSR